LTQSSLNNPSRSRPLLLILGAWVLALFAGAGLYLLAETPAAAAFGALTARALALSSDQVMWYITRASGLTAYLLLWLSTAWGLAVSSKILDRLLNRAFTYDYHQFISLLALGFVGLHVGVLLFDHFLPYTLPQALVPFLSPYRPLWVGIGVLAFYASSIVTATFYLRRRIGMHAFRTIHYFSLLAYLGAAVHALMAGTDSSLAATQIMYAATFLSVVFLMTYWLTGKLQEIPRWIERQRIRRPQRVRRRRASLKHGRGLRP
jgi:sulfoxide reductase heme-binding subunit YedZ